MTKQKQFNNKTGAVLTQTTPEQDRSLITVPQELRRAYPNVKPEYMQKALERCREQLNIAAKLNTQAVSS